MPFDSYLNDALLFAAVALGLVLIALLLRSPARATMLGMLVVAAVGVLGLWAVEEHAGLVTTRTASVLAHEAALALVAFGVIQITVLFVFQTVLARRRIPRILNEFVVALALIGYAIYRLNAVGVNLAGLITTSAVVSGALAFSAKETLGNLWGGIAHPAREDVPHRRLGAHRHRDGPGGEHPLAVHGHRHDQQRDDRHSERRRDAASGDRDRVVAARNARRGAATCRSRSSSTMRPRA